jgi:DNA polymerase
MAPEDAAARAAALEEMTAQARGCVRCPHLVRTRTQVVVGTGDADADVMLVGEAPGRDEDEAGVPFVGRSGRLLTELLAEAGLAREDVYIANVLKCRPPENRNPAPAEIENCAPWLHRQIDLVRPVVVVTLGTFATKLLRGGAQRITEIRGRDEVREIGGRPVRLLPVFHPAAALYRRANVEVLRADLARLPALVALGAPAAPRPNGEAADPAPAEAQEAAPAEVAPAPASDAAPAPAPRGGGSSQLELF